VREIVADAPALFAALKRVDIERIGRIDDEPLADRLAGHDQVLCVVNTRDHAGDLFRLLKDKAGNGVFHLSASMCARHRSAVLRLIRRKLECGDACRVVSTQLVEAGVDVDFPAVYRAMSGIDSIAQAAGRCNREGRLDRGHVYVFDTDVDPRGDLRLRRDKGLETASLHEDLLGLDAIDRYFTLLYWSRNDEWDKHEIMKCFSYSKDGLHAQFRQAAEKYRLIRDEQQPVIVPYGREGNRLIDELRAMRDPPTRSFARRAQRYTVGVHPWRLRRLIDNAAITLYHERFWVLEDSRGYDPDLGLGGDSDGPDPERFLC
jgi:CRISPR-associated endonuclease/helicase Cas3